MKAQVYAYIGTWTLREPQNLKPPKTLSGLLGRAHDFDLQRRCHDSRRRARVRNLGYQESFGACVI